jgi:hypothetical protein
MNVSMNGLRMNLSRDVDKLREMVLLVLQDNEWYDKEELIDAMNDVICDSNVLNCVYTEDDNFKNMSDVCVERIEGDQQ